MTQTEAEEIKIQIEEFNKSFAPVELRFDMYRNDKYDSSEDNWWVTIVYNYTPEEWMEFVTIGFNYNQVCDKLFGFGFGLESVKMYQEEYGNLKFSQSDLPLGQDNNQNRLSLTPQFSSVFWGIFLTIFFRYVNHIPIDKW